MKQEEIKQLSTSDLRDKIKGESAVFSKLKFSHAVSPIENPMKIKTYRRLIASLKTELRKRELTPQS